MSDLREDIRNYIDGLAEQMLYEPDRSSPLSPQPRRPYRLRRAVYALVAVVSAVLMLVSVLTLTERSRRDTITVAGGGHPSPGTFVPPTRTEGQREVIPLVFPDGATVVLSYPAGVDLARLGFTPAAAIEFPGGHGLGTAHPCCGRELTIMRGTVAEVLPGAPTRTYMGAQGQPVQFFDTSDPHGFAQLAFQFGSWVVLAFDYPSSAPANGERMSDEQRALFAANLDAHVDAAGFLVFDPRAPLCLGAPDAPNGKLGDGDLMIYFRTGSFSRVNARGYGVRDDGNGVSMFPPGANLEVRLAPRVSELVDDIEVGPITGPTVLGSCPTG